MRGLVVPGAIAVAACLLGVHAGCRGTTFFACSDDQECGDGWCEANGACSFSDADCASGRRYGDSSEPGVAGECVAVDGTSGGTTGDGTGSASTLMGTLDGTASVATTTTAVDGSDDDTASTTGNPGCPTDWWDCAWSHRHLVTTKTLDEPLDDVPVLVLLGSARVDFDRMQADGEDLRFVTTDGAAAPFEIERWDPAGVSTIWVLLPRLGASPEALWIYYGNPIAEHVQDATAVWTEPHVAVWHMGDAWTDATIHAHDATTNGQVSVTGGQIVDAAAFESADARLDVAPTDSLTDVFSDGATLSAWIRPSGWGGGTFGRIVNKQDGPVGWQWYVGAEGRLRFGVGFDADGMTWSTADGALSLDRWSHVAVAFTFVPGELPLLYVDGVPQRIVEGGPVPRTVLPTDADVPVTLGNRPTNDRRFDGRIDEIRVERTLRSAAWLDLQGASMRDETFVYGVREDRGPVP